MSEWIPLVEYSAKKGVSMSTLRRHIKAGKIQHRVENGRYLVADESGKSRQTEQKRMGTGAEVDREHFSTSAKIEKLEKDLHRAQEEIAELKMLVALYEDKMSFGRRDN